MNMCTFNNDFTNSTEETNNVCEKATIKSIWHKIIYKDSSFRAVLLFIGICCLNLISVFSFGYGYWYFVEPIGGYQPNIVALAFYLIAAVFLIIYTMMCCRKRLLKQLTGITAALGVVAFGTIVTSGIFYPIFNALSLIFAYITNSPDHESTLFILIAYIMNFAAVIAFACISGHSINHPKNQHKFSLVKITAIFSVICAGFLVIYGFAFAKYEYEWFNEEYYIETPQESYLSQVTKEQRNLYSHIKIGDDASATEKQLIQKGFVKQNKSYDDYIGNCLFPYYINEYLEKRNPEKTIGNSCAIYCYTDGIDDPESYADSISCIIISYDQNGKINYKLFIPNTNSFMLDGCYLDYQHGEESQNWYNNLQTGKSSDSTLDFIRNTGAFIIEDEKYENEIKSNSYKIILQCYYPIKPDFMDFLFDIDASSMDYFNSFELTATDDIISDKQFSSMW